MKITLFCKRQLAILFMALALGHPILEATEGAGASVRPKAERVNSGPRESARLIKAPTDLMRYGRNHHVEALFVIDHTTLEKFHEKESRKYSSMKYGDRDAIYGYAAELASKIWEQHGAEIRENASVWRVVVPAIQTIPTSASLLAADIVGLLERKAKSSLESISIKRRKAGVGDFGKLKERSERIKQIQGNFYFDGEDLSGKKLLFIEDALVSGTHYQETQRVLLESGADLEDVYAYFVADVRKGDLGVDYSTEAEINNSWINHDYRERFLEILQQEDVEITLRMLKFILGSKESTAYFRRELENEQLLQVLDAARQEEFHTKPEYCENYEEFLKQVDYKKVTHCQI